MMLILPFLGLNQAQVELPWFSEENWEKAQKTFSFALVKPRGRVYYYTTKESPTMKWFTSSVFSFEEMIRNGYLYVDKTEYIWERIEPPIGTYFLVNFDKDTGQIDKWTEQQA